MNTPRKPERENTHGEMIIILLNAYKDILPEKPVFVETGCGISTLKLAEAGRKYGAVVYSCDINEEKVTELKRRAGSRVDNVNFIIGDSLTNLARLAEQYPQIHFHFLDAAASAMHTFLEFQAAENSLRHGSILLMDNAAFPSETKLLSPCRKGKIIVPYLQASAYWRVSGHPLAGDSMISAVRSNKADFADSDYEWPEYTDPWEWSFDNEWE